MKQRMPRHLTLRTLRRRKRTPKLTMSPMVDCVFLLLIFFMVSTTFVPQPGIRVELPPGFDGYKRPTGLILKIYNPIDNREDGTMLLNGHIVGYDEMFPILLNTPADQKAMLMIHSGRDVFHKQIVSVIDRAKSAGFDKIGFALTARE